MCIFSGGGSSTVSVASRDRGGSKISRLLFLNFTNLIHQFLHNTAQELAETGLKYPKVKKLDYSHNIPFSS